MASRWSGPLSTTVPNPKLDLDDYVGQRSSTFQFEIVDAITGYRQTVNPLEGTIPVLSHDISRVVKRQISNLFLSVADTRKINTISSRLDISMLVGGEVFPLGRYMPNNQLRFISTAGTQSSQSFYDEGFIVDQELTSSFGSLFRGEQLLFTVNRLLERYPIDFTVEFTTFAGTVSWPAGTRGGYVVDQLALDGDWFSPWFDNTNVMRWIRSFDPATAEPTFDLDTGNRVTRAGIIESDDLISAPNRFVVISNGSSSVGVNASDVMGVYEVPSSAPHSIANRGFTVQRTLNRQLDSSLQAQAVAQNIGLQSTVFETVELTTPPDPRHDSYDVLRWQGSNWLEIGWSMSLIEGGAMHHTARKAYGT